VKKYQYFSATDFVTDEYFQSWILHPNEDTKNVEEAISSMGGDNLNTKVWWGK